MPRFGSATDSPQALVVEGGAMRGIFAAGVLDEFIQAHHYPFSLCLGVSAGSTALAAYLSGQVQYVATGNLVVAAISRQNADKAPVPSFMLKDSPCFIGLKKNEPALKAKVDALIEQGIKDGTLNGLSEQWLKAPLPANLGA